MLLHKALVRHFVGYRVEFGLLLRREKNPQSIIDAELGFSVIQEK